MLTNKEEENCCFICFEFKLKRERKPKRLKDQNLYIKTCECDGFIHNICLKTWHETSRKCPICREFMLNSKNNINNEIITTVVTIITEEPPRIIVRDMGIRMRTYVYIQKNWNKVAAIINILFLLYLSYYFYITVTSNINDDAI